MDKLDLLHGQLLTFTLDGEFFIVCFGGVAWVGFAGKAGFKGDFDDDFSSISLVVSPAAEKDRKFNKIVKVECLNHYCIQIENKIF